MPQSVGKYSTHNNNNINNLNDNKVSVEKDKKLWIII